MSDRYRAETASSPLARVMMVPVVTWLAVFIAVPLVVMLTQHVASSDVSRVLGRASTWRLLWYSTWQASLSVVATLVVSAPITWLVSRHSFRGRRIVRAIGTLPFLLPSVVVATAFLAVLPRSLQYTTVAVVTAHTYFNIAVVLRIVGARVEMLDANLVGAARTLGASPIAAFRTVTWPLMRSAVASAISVVFLYCFTSFAVVRVLGGPQRSTVESDIALRALGIGDVPAAVILSVLQFVCIALVVALVRVGMRSDIPLRRTGAVRLPSVPPRLRHVARATMFGTVAFVVVPLTALFVRSFRVGDEISTAAWASLFSGSTGSFPIRESIISSLRVAIVAGVVGLVLSVLATVSIVRLRTTGRLLDAAVVAPLAVSPVTLGLALIVTFDTGFFDLRANWWFVVVAHTLVAFPLAVRVLVPAWRAIPAGVNHAAATLGAGETRRLFDVDLRMMRRAMVGALGLVAAVSLGEFGAATLMSRGGAETMPVAISRLLERTGDLVRAQAFVLASLLVVTCLLALLAIETASGRGQDAARI